MNKQKTECPFCGEGVNPLAIECPYCGERLPEPDGRPVETLSADPTDEGSKYEWTDEAGPSWISRIFRSLCYAVGGYLLFHFGSWSVAWDKRVSALEQILMKYRNGQHLSDSRVIHDLLTDEKSNLIINHDGVMVRVNDSYYGFVNNFQFFDSPVIQWAMLFAALTAFYFAITTLLGFED